MTHYNVLKAKLPNSQLDKLKLRIKNWSNFEAFIKCCFIKCDSKDENNFHKFLLTNTQVSRLYKAFSNNSWANINLSKTHFDKIGQSGGFLGTLLGPLQKTGFPLVKDLVKPIAKNFLIPLGLTVAALATDAGIHKKMFWIWYYNISNF